MRFRLSHELCSGSMVLNRSSTASVVIASKSEVGGSGPGPRAAEKTGNGPPSSRKTAHAASALSLGLVNSQPLPLRALTPLPISPCQRVFQPVMTPPLERRHDITALPGQYSGPVPHRTGHASRPSARSAAMCGYLAEADTCGARQVAAFNGLPAVPREASLGRV